MTAPAAIQLYTLRDELARDFSGTVEQVAALGYLGVETAGFPGTTPEAAARLFNDLGLAVAGAHVPLPLGPARQEALDALAALGCSRAVCAYMPPEQFKTVDSLRRVCDSLNEAHAVIAENGLTLGYHNHWWEFQEVEGQLAHDWMREFLHPDIFFEIDTYWVKTAGRDPAASVRDLGGRAPLLHLKDGPAVQGRPMLPLGAGVMDIPAIVAAGAGSTEWLIVELDASEMDMLAAVKESYRYLIERGLARGRNG
jgi:sugar phosphate isomerase/epimerase